MKNFEGFIVIEEKPKNGKRQSSGRKNKPRLIKT